MGYSISWLAVKADDESKLLDSLSLEKTGETGDFGDSLLTGRLLFPDWYLIVVDDRTLYREHKKFNFYMFEDKYLEKISRENSSVVVCKVDETSMYSSIALWEEGKLKFLAEHSGDMGDIYYIEESGLAPEAYAEIKKKYFKEQEEAGGNEADVDYIFEIPTMLAYEITGFKHDQMDSLEPPSYDFLSFEWPELKSEPKKIESKESSISVSKKPWWKFW